jgi:hypothetical protein
MAKTHALVCIHTCVYTYKRANPGFQDFKNLIGPEVWVWVSKGLFGLASYYLLSNSNHLKSTSYIRGSKSLPTPCSALV